MQQVPADKREATAKALDAELRKFVEENVGYLRERSFGALPGTSSAILEERFNEDELREILTWMEARPCPSSAPPSARRKSASPKRSCPKPARRWNPASVLQTSVRQAAGPAASGRRASRQSTASTCIGRPTQEVRP